MSDTVPPSPGDLYVVARWAELTDADAVWFGRSADVGHRLRLAELIALAEANLAGGVRAESVSDLLRETVEGLTNSDLYAAERFPEVAEEASGMARGASAFLPGSAGHAAAEACLEHLDGSLYLDGLVDAVVSRAGEAKQTISGLHRVDVLVELLDSELAYGGHSRTWRADVVRDVRQRMEDDHTSLSKALPAALADAYAGSKREFEIMIPLDGIEDLDAAPAWMQEPDSAGEVIATWAEDGRAEAQQVVQAAQRTRRDSVEAVDVESALRAADDRLRRLLNVWNLRGWDLPYPESAVVYDAARRRAVVRPLPSEPLNLAPEGLDEWSPDVSGGLLHGAVDQLAQARTARPSAAFVDLWTAAETLYGGGVEDRRYKAGLVMARMAEYSYIADSHVWLARRADAAGMGVVPQGGELKWLMDTLGTGDGAQALEQALTAGGDLLAWRRFKAMSKWDEGWGLRNELDALHLRLKRVVDRAYLIRNFAVHRADESLPTLGVMLPMFAGLVQVCVDLSMRRSRSDRHPLTEAKAASLTVRAIADDFGRGRSRAPEGLRPALLDS